MTSEWLPRDEEPPMIAMVSKLIKLTAHDHLLENKGILNSYHYVEPFVSRLSIESRSPMLPVPPKT